MKLIRGMVVVTQIKLSISNVYLVKSDRPVLVDAGAKGDMVALESALGKEGVAVKDLAAVLVTHGHSDHAALALELKRRGAAAIVVGKGDRPMVEAGHNDELNPMNFMARVLKIFAIDPRYNGFSPDVDVDGEMDLRRFGIEGRAIQMPGHTPGSTVFVLDDGRAFVGDMMLGGWFGGALFPGRAGEHYFHADPVRNHANIARLLPVAHTFYVGHGGPLARDSVAKFMDSIKGQQETGS